jgi:2-hydroxy-3-oxopropionate reductase
MNMRRTILAAMPDTVGFIGLGLMGRPMATNLLNAGYPLVVHNRSQGPVEALVALGATAAATPGQVAAKATRIITMVPDSPDVERVLEGDDGVFRSIQPGTIVIDMSSIAPATARRLADRAQARGATMLDAPVSGGEIGAINGTLSIMVGGDEAAFAAVRPLLDVMGNPERVVRIGESGAGQVCKLCNQMVLAGTIAAVGEALALARKAGADPTRVREALLGGFAQSRVLEVHGERMLAGNYVPGFRTELFAKDLRNVEAAVAENAIPAPVTAAATRLVNVLVEQGREKNDYSELGKLIAELAGLE